MKIIHKGPTDPNLSQLVKNEKTVTPARPSEENRVERTGESARISISPEARELQKVVALAKAGDEIRADKVKDLKELIAKGEYQVEAIEVAKSMIRSEVSRLLTEE